MIVVELDGRIFINRDVGVLQIVSLGQVVECGFAGEFGIIVVNWGTATDILSVWDQISMISWSRVR